MNKSNERVRMLIDNLAEGSVAEFALNVGENTQTVRNWILRGVGKRIVPKIINAYPQVRKEWLENGEGDMFIEGIDTPETIGAREVIESICQRENIQINQLANIVGIPLRTLKSLCDVNKNMPIENAKKIVAILPQYNLQWVFSGRGSMLNKAIVEGKAETRGERIDLIRQKYCGIGRGSMTEFSEIVGESIFSVSQWVRRGDKIGMAVIDKVSNAFPDINFEWLMYGKGGMYNKTDEGESEQQHNNNSCIGNNEDVIQMYKENIEQRNMLIEMLQKQIKEQLEEIKGLKEKLSK